MNKGLYLITFAVGALAGSAASWFILKKKYERIAQEEIDSVKEAFKKRYSVEHEESEEKDEKAADDDKEKDLKAYNDVLNTTKYGSDAVTKKSPSYMRVISPVELGDIEHYSIVGLTYYADKILADDDGNIINIDETVGADALTQFGEYDDGAVHVRNSKTQTDYEVLLDERDYSEVFN